MPPLKLAIVGGGPSAFYVASRLLSLLPKTSAHSPTLKIHLYDRLWAPYGLVRYGVAPDHPEVKVSFTFLMLISTSQIIATILGFLRPYGGHGTVLAPIPALEHGEHGRILPASLFLCPTCREPRIRSTARRYDVLSYARPAGRLSPAFPIFRGGKVSNADLCCLELHTQIRCGGG